MLTNTQNNFSERNQKLLRSRIDQSTQYIRKAGDRESICTKRLEYLEHPLMSDGIVHELNNGHVTVKTIELV